MGKFRLVSGAVQIGRAFSRQHSLPSLRMTASAGEELSADEIALYDRQLRLWGIEAQNRMRKASVLLVTMRALGNEIAKNLVLAGIGSLTVLDSDTVTEADVESGFFVTEEHIGRNRAEAATGDIQRLNPRVLVHHDSSQCTSKAIDFFEQFSVVIVTELPLSDMILLNSYCRACNIPFYAASLHGLYGIVFVDLIEHTFLVDHPQPVRDVSKPTQSATKRTEKYCTLAQSLSTSYGKLLKPRQARKVSPLLPMSLALLSWLDSYSRNPLSNDIDVFADHVSAEVASLSLPSTLITRTHVQEFISQLTPTDLSGVAAVVGGILSQDVLNALGGRELPLKNWLILDGRSCRPFAKRADILGEGKIYALMGETNGEATS